MNEPIEIERLAQQIEAGQRRAIARGLTLVESTLEHHEKLTLSLFACLGKTPRGFRLGVTGPPGAGKSTLIERLVLSWLEHGEKVAVLAIDPSSRRTGGSLLGDKTRMGQIAQDPRVFIRPSPNRETLGGLGLRTPLACALLERAGYHRIIVETVGVGQSEIGARYLVDRLLLVALPGAGDEVQGLKRGLMEEVDVVAVNKSDLGDSQATVAILRSALRVFRRDVPVFGLSALTGEGWTPFLEEISRGAQATESSRREGEVYLFEQYTLQALSRILHREGRGRWFELKRQLERGEVDFLEILPQLYQTLEELSW